MKVRTTLSHHNKYNSLIFEQPIFNDQDQMSTIAALVTVLSPRNRIIESIYKAQKSLSFSKSTLYLAIGILDKLICLDLTLNNENSDLICGTLLLMCTKFNEVYPVTIKKMNRLMNNQYFQQYVDMEGYFLHKLDFNLYLEDTLYQDLSILESQLNIQYVQNGQYIIKYALLNPQKTFKNGSKSLIYAIENLLSRNLPKNLNNFQQQQMLQIRGQLFKLHLGNLN